MDWQSYRFLESAGNLKAALGKALDRTPNTAIATEIATCLQQGRMFFDTAQTSPLEIRPLLVQYGMIAMGKALVASRTLKAMHTFTPSHGLSDVSAYNAKVDELRVSVLGSGSFQEFNDAVRCLDWCSYYGERNEPLRLFLERADAASLAGKTLTFADVFSRLTSQRELYEKTFGVASNCLHGRFHVKHDGVPTVDVYVEGVPKIDRVELKKIVGVLRSEHDFLGHLVLGDASCSWGQLYLQFAYFDLPVENDLDEPNLIERKGSFVRSGARPALRDWRKNPPPISTLLAVPSAGNLECARPLHGVRHSQHALTYLAVYMLGSLVRYRPQTWVHAMTSRVTENRQLDDKPIALIESFLRETLAAFPHVIVNAITVRREDSK